MPGTLGGNQRLKIYGRLDCPSALRGIAPGHYARQRVFFADEEAARAAGYRPCRVCMGSGLESETKRETLAVAADHGADPPV